MKYIIPFLIVVLAACKGTTAVIDPVEPPVIKPEVSIYAFDTTAYETKEPFVTIVDRGLEAYLVIYGFDSDNAVNGKISVADIGKITYLSLRVPTIEAGFPETVLANLRYDYFGEKYNVLDKTNLSIIPYQRTDFYKIPIKSFVDFKNFGQLQGLQSDVFEGIKVFDLTGLSQLLSFAIFNSQNDIEIANHQTGLGQLYIFYQKFYQNDVPKDIAVELTNLNFLGYLTLGNVGKFKSDTKKLYQLSLDNCKIGENDFNNIYCPDLTVLRLNNNSNLKNINIPKIKRLDLYLENSPNLESINFENLENLSYLHILNNPNLKELDLSKYKEIYSLWSLGNSKLDTISLNSNQKIGVTSDCTYCRWGKDSWTSWKVK